MKTERETELDPSALGLALAFLLAVLLLALCGCASPAGKLPAPISILKAPAPPPLPPSVQTFARRTNDALPRPGAPFVLEFTGTAAELGAYEIVTSTDRVTWADAARVAAQDGLIRWTNATPTEARRFYRVKVVVP